MALKGCWAVLVLASLLHLSQGMKFLLTVPKEPHYDTNFVATVTAFGLEPGTTQQVLLEYRGFRDRSRVLNHTSMEFSSDGVKTWTMKFLWVNMKLMYEPGVVLRMSSGQQEEETELMFSQKNGYIFIQTDKPVYTPRQTVKFRVIAVNEEQELARYHLKVDIRNDKQIIVDRMRYSAKDAFKAQEFEIPRDTPPGIWSITANFEELDNSIGSSHTVKFEIREYVLPRFSATLDIDTEVITKDSQWITATVRAQYVYGRPVFGNAVMQVGVWDPQTGIQLFPQLYSKELVNGVYTQDIRVSHLFPSNKPFPMDKRFYVNVNVTESATLENFTIVDTSIFLAHPYYVVNFDKAKKYFRPGFPYTLEARVTAQSGTPAPWTWLLIKYTYLDGLRQPLQSSYVYNTLDGHGEISQDFDIPATAQWIEFRTIVADAKRNSFQEYPFTVEKLPSPNNAYIHISMEAPLKKRRDGRVLLRYTPDSSSPIRNGHSEIITVLVIAKGHILYSTTTYRNRDGRSVVNIPKSLYQEASPSIRIVAYYHIEGAKPEFIMDSLKVKTDHVCLEEVDLWLNGLKGLYKPKDSYELQVDGGAAMTVGFVAVDTAVLLINDKQTLTRDELFQVLGSHDLGLESGDGKDMTQILMNSGLTFLTLDPDKPATPLFDRIQGSSVEKDKSSVGIKLVTEVRPQTVRKYFPESWLFEERVLPSSGRMTLNLTLPDSITTWSFMAVGVSARRGVCVSKPLEQPVHKLFFADVRLPYKATRLEEVKVKIAVYNYQIYALAVKVLVTGSDGLCFSANTARDASQNSTQFTLNIPANQVAAETVKIIPLKNGDLTLRVDLESQNERDIVERTLHVVAEGLRVRKSITFVLDPEARHAAYKAVKKQKIVVEKTATLENLYDLEKKEQKTKIDLALPREVIKGTELCRIAAFGDLMGDIITHAVVQSKSLIDQKVLNAEEVMGDLSPTVYALLYANTTDLIDDELRERGRRFITHGVARLLKYHRDRYFVLNENSKPATWLTAFALKTLCSASSLAFVDKNSLIDEGFNWLLDQTAEDGSMQEQDWRLAKNSFEYRVMLSAEVLIAIMECKRESLESHIVLMGNLVTFLEDNLDAVKEPMVLAKVAYALQSFDSEAKSTEDAIHRLARLKRRNKLNQFYWSDEENDEAKHIPHWYHDGAKASSIEATAYALLVFKHDFQWRVNVDPIADWLVAQRNHNGAFIGAMDSSAAIYALSQYSLGKHGVEIDLNCNVTSDRLKEILHTFKFTEKNATQLESLSNVPVGQILEVVTRGHGLGQMQVNMEYNVPIDKNLRCPFQITINISKTMIRFREDMHSNPLCASCDIGCPSKITSEPSVEERAEEEAEEEEIDLAEITLLGGVKPDVANPVSKRITNRRRRPRCRSAECRRERQGRVGQRRQKPSKPGREKRSPTASKRSICLHICLQPQEETNKEQVIVEIEMLTGFLPVAGDIERIREDPNVRSAEFSHQTEILTVELIEVSAAGDTCISFRAVDEEEVGRQTAATVKVTEVGKANPSCVADYYPVSGEESLQVYCADFSHISRGECRCFSGLCSTCVTSTVDMPDFYTLQQEVCKADVVYQLKLQTLVDMGQWTEIAATVVSINKTGTHQIVPDDLIKMITPSSCMCPIYSYRDRRENMYMLSPAVEKMVDRNGNEVYQYLLDEKTLFLKVADPSQPDSEINPVPISFFNYSLYRHVCPA